MNLDESLDLEQLRVHVPLWAWLVVALAVAAVYAFAMSNASTMKAAGATLHEFFHDGRHFLGVPCH
jgi:hypothetical protein